MIDFSHTKINLRRPLSDYSKVRQLCGTLLRGRRFQLRKHCLGTQYLNIGSGPNLLPDFINIDYLWMPGIDLCWDVTEGIPLPDHSIIGIFVEHCLEHFSHDTCLRVLKEFHRLLAPGGTVRVVVPDAELYINLYVQARAGKPIQFPYVNEPRPDGFMPIAPLNRIFRDHGHLYAYDAEAMISALTRAGFAQTEKTSFMKGRDPKLLVDSEERAVESLYVEATT